MLYFFVVLDNIDWSFCNPKAQGQKFGVTVFFLSQYTCNILSLPFQGYSPVFHTVCFLSGRFHHSLHAFHYFPLYSWEQSNSACFAFCDAVSSFIGSDVFHQSIQLSIFYFTEQQQFFYTRVERYEKEFKWNAWESNIDVHRKNSRWHDIGLGDKCWNWLSEHRFYSAVIFEEWKSHVNGNS